MNIKSIFILIVSLIAWPLAAQVDVDWDGTTGGWSDPTNWTGDQLPGATDNARISNDGTAQVADGDDIAVGELTLGVASGTSGTLDLSGTGTLNVNGGAGTLTLGVEAGASGTLNVTSGDATLNAATITTGAGTGSVVLGSGSNITLNASLSGTLALEITDGYKWLLGDNTHTGGTTVTGGALLIGDGGTSGSITGDISTGASTSVYFRRSDDYTYAGAISGGAFLHGTTNGTLTLTGENTHTAGTRIDGTLQIGDGGTTGSITSDIRNNHLLIFNRSNASTYAGSITGELENDLIKRGAGVLTLTGMSTYLGDTRIQGGTLQFDAGGGLTQARNIYVGDTGTGALTINGGSVTAARTYLGNGTDDNGTLNVLSGALDTILRVGGEGDGTFNLSGGSVTSDSVIVGGEDGGVGIINISGGTLTSNRTNIGSSLDAMSTVTISGGTWNETDEFIVGDGGLGTLNLSGSGTLNVDGGDGSIVLGNYESDAVGTLNFGNGGAGIGHLNVDSIDTYDGSGVIVFDHTGTATFAPDIYGDITLTKNGPGTTILTGYVSLDGATTVNAGALLNNASLYAEVTVADGATLGGSGEFGEGVIFSSGAILAPGAALGEAGTITFEGGLILNGGAVIDFDLGAVSDLIIVNGGDLIGPESGLVTLNFDAVSGFAEGDYTLFNYAGATLDNFDLSDFFIGTGISDYDFTLSIVDSTLVATATYSAVPEPSTYAAIFGVVALFGAMWMRRRRA